MNLENRNIRRGRTVPREERGAVAIIVAFAIVTLLAFILIAVQVGDVGMVRGLLQGSADQAALAGARKLNGKASGLTSAHSDALAILAGGKNFPQAVNMGSDLDISGSAYQTGVWDLKNPALGFKPSTDPAEVNAVQVIGRKTSVQNQEVPMFLGGFLGPETVPVARKAIAAVGGCGELPCNVELPIAACAEDLTCGVEYRLLTSNSNVDNACWTGFFSGANGNNVAGYINNCGTIPDVEAGDIINFNNGNITGPGYQNVRDRLSEWQTAHGGSVDSQGRAVCVGTGNVQIPDPDNLTCNSNCGPVVSGPPVDVNGDGVVNTLDCGMPRWIPMIARSKCSSNCNQSGAITGFALMVVIQVKDTGNPKFIQGIPLCGIPNPGAPTDSTAPTCSPSSPSCCATQPVLVNKDLL